jgi:hypothetical protein
VRAGCCVATAAEFKPIDGGKALVMTGVIEFGDDMTFSDALLAVKATSVYVRRIFLNSKGGRPGRPADRAVDPPAGAERAHRHDRRQDRRALLDLRRDLRGRLSQGGVRDLEDRRAWGRRAQRATRRLCQ